LAVAGLGLREPPLLRGDHAEPVVEDALVSSVIRQLADPEPKGL
jgi:hypothetical protein